MKLFITYGIAKCSLIKSYELHVPSKHHFLAAKPVYKTDGLVNTKFTAWIVNQYIVWCTLPKNTIAQMLFWLLYSNNIGKDHLIKRWSF